MKEIRILYLKNLDRRIILKFIIRTWDWTGLFWFSIGTGEGLL
jgi:hypothetical protein